MSVPRHASRNSKLPPPSPHQLQFCLFCMFLDVRLEKTDFPYSAQQEINIWISCRRHSPTTQTSMRNMILGYSSHFFPQIKYVPKVKHAFRSWGCLALPELFFVQEGDLLPTYIQMFLFPMDPELNYSFLDEISHRIFWNIRKTQLRPNNLV